MLPIWKARAYIGLRWVLLACATPIVLVMLFVFVGIGLVASVVLGAIIREVGFGVAGFGPTVGVLDWLLVYGLHALGVLLAGLFWYDYFDIRQLYFPAAPGKTHGSARLARRPQPADRAAPALRRGARASARSFRTC